MRHKTYQYVSGLLRIKTRKDIPDKSGTTTVMSRDDYTIWSDVWVISSGNHKSDTLVKYIDCKDPTSGKDIVSIDENSNAFNLDLLIFVLGKIYSEPDKYMERSHVWNILVDCITSLVGVIEDRKNYEV